jgi:hypothetical protein
MVLLVYWNNSPLYIYTPSVGVCINRDTRVLTGLQNSNLLELHLTFLTDSNFLTDFISLNYPQN